MPREDMKRGKFIVLEGGERSGKGSAVKHIRTTFPKGKLLFTREPGGTPFAEQVRNMFLTQDISPETELLMLFAARLDHAEKVIAPALKKGIHVVCERWNASTYAYQIVGRRALDHKTLFTRLEALVDAIASPDLYIYLEVPAEVSEKRLKKERAKRDRIELAGLAFHQRVRTGYDAFMRGKRVVRVDATQGLESFFHVIDAVVRTETGL
jgi:dTMP kinase